MDVSGNDRSERRGPSGGLRRVQPLCGPEGATAVYGPQKGVTPEQIPMLDAALAHYAGLLEAAWGDAFGDRPGAGAAGGLASPSTAPRGASGAGKRTGGAGGGPGRGPAGGRPGDHRRGRHRRADRPSRVARRARAQGVPVVCLSGALLPGCEALYAEGSAPCSPSPTAPYRSSRAYGGGADPPGQRQPAAPVPGGPVSWKKVS